MFMFPNDIFFHETSIMRLWNYCCCYTEDTKDSGLKNQNRIIDIVRKKKCEEEDMHSFVLNCNNIKKEATD